MRITKLNFIKFGLVEQAITSFLNFFIILVFSKALESTEFANFVILFSSISLIFLINTSLWSNPILVFLTTKFEKKSFSYIKNLSLNNLAFSGLFSFLFLLIVDSTIRDLDILEISLASIFVTLWSQYELFRKILYALNYSWVILISTGALLGSFTTLTLFLFNKLNIYICLITLSTSYLVAIILLIMLYVKKDLHLLTDEKKVSNFNVIEIHWNYAKWTLMGVVLFWLASQGYLLLISKYISDEQLGGFRIALNLLGVMSILFVYFENTYTTVSSNIFYKSGVRELNIFLKSISRKLLLPFLGTMLLAICFSYLMFATIFVEYSESIFLTVIFGVYQIILGLYRPAIVGLRAMNKTKPFFIGNLILVIITYSLGIYMVMNFTILGAAMTYLISTLIITMYFNISLMLEIKLEMKKIKEECINI